MPTYRYYANQQMKKDYDPETGEYEYFMPGDEIPLDRFGSGQALRAALHRNQISAIAVADSRVAASPQATLTAAASAEADKAEAAAEGSGSDSVPTNEGEQAEPAADASKGKTKSGG